MVHTIQTIHTHGWNQYELIDSGNKEKLERFGDTLLIRPDPRILWEKTNPSQWDMAAARYNPSLGRGEWEIRSPLPSPWTVSYKHLTFSLKPTEFKHVGIFPEQSYNWDFIAQNSTGKKLNVLNLFGYTGGATLAAASSGAFVTHVDSSKGTIGWAKENARLSNIPDTAIRWIEDDAMKFVLREGRRGNSYDAIIMDPPRFGRGSKGEVWKLEDNLTKLLVACAAILSPSPSYLIVNAYTADLSSIVLSQLVSQIFKRDDVESGELLLTPKNDGNSVPSGIFTRFGLPLK